MTKIDKWFLEKLKHIVDIDEAMKKCNINTLDQDLLRTAKVYGFTDFQVARAVGLEQELGNMHKAALLVRNKRKSYGILPVVKQIDTLAAEYPVHAELEKFPHDANGHGEAEGCQGHIHRRKLELDAAVAVEDVDQGEARGGAQEPRGGVEHGVPIGIGDEIAPQLPQDLRREGQPRKLIPRWVSMICLE